MTKPNRLSNALAGALSALLISTAGASLAAEPKAAAKTWTHIEWNQTLSEMPQGDALRGAQLHRDGLCMTCHGDAGVAPSRNAPSLAGQTKEYTYKTLLDYQSGLRNEGDGKAKLMQAATLPMSNQDMADLAVYYAQQALPIRVAQPDTEPKIDHMIRKGEVSRMIIACASCHGAHGEGNGITPALAGQTSDYFMRTMQAYRDKKRSNDIHEGMAQFAYELSDAEIQALADYYAGLGYQGGAK
ncbi:cytochrome C552 [Thiomicrospira aerophila AL3]|uniref:Cytochrome C552 n=1 Tax=Thiomicrospira aerophila AL3 TaxID=717772 RepID=W0DU98_9GAMM|nr:c-type cytochrome [Thiomicrospira aerophila]AHF00843.1 cytochrome C552 [Thiomicrospira aerophila AL3]